MITHDWSTADLLDVVAFCGDRVSERFYDDIEPQLATLSSDALFRLAGLDSRDRDNFRGCGVDRCQTGFLILDEYEALPCTTVCATGEPAESSRSALSLRGGSSGHWLLHDLMAATDPKRS